MKDELNNSNAGDAGPPGSPSDPWLDSLLDEALGPGTVKDSMPTGLAERIFEATRHRLVAPRRSVLARIGRGQWNAIAAAIVLATGAGVWFAASNIGQQSVPGGEEPRIALNNQSLVPETRAWPGEAAVDQDLSALSMRVEDSERGWTTANSLDNGSDDVDESDASRGSSVF